MCRDEGAATRHSFNMFLMKMLHTYTHITHIISTHSIFDMCSMSHSICVNTHANILKCRCGKPRIYVWTGAEEEGQDSGRYGELVRRLSWEVRQMAPKYTQAFSLSHTHTRIRTHAYIRAHACCTHTHTYTYTHTHTHTHIHTRIYTRTRLVTYTHTHTHTHAYANTHTHTHIQVRQREPNYSVG